MVHPGGFLRGSFEEPGMWCPGCKEMHVLPWKRGNWAFNGNTEKPTFTPSFRITWRDEDGVAKQCCHFVLTDGVLHFCSDCTHELVGKSVPLPKLPPELTDPERSPHDKETGEADDKG